MACAPASERNRAVATTRANGSLLPELQTPRTSKVRFGHLRRHGSSCSLFAGTGEPAKRSFSRRTLPQAKARSLACFRLHAENETTCSIQCDAHRPTRLPRHRRPPHPIRRCATASRLYSALVRAVSTASCFWGRFALGAVDRIREVKAKIVEAGNLAAEALCLVRLALPRNARQHEFAPIL